MGLDGGLHWRPGKDLNSTDRGLVRMCIHRKLWPIRNEVWFRDVDSNHDTQLQRLMSYRLDDPGTDTKSVAEPRKCAQVRSKPFARLDPVEALRYE
jgi:hypothetical protein